MLLRSIQAALAGVSGVVAEVVDGEILVRIVGPYGDLHALSDAADALNLARIKSTKGRRYGAPVLLIRNEWRVAA